MPDRMSINTTLNNQPRKVESVHFLREMVFIAFILSAQYEYLRPNKQRDKSVTA
jgi:hypothetical protein